MKKINSLIAALFIAIGLSAQTTLPLIATFTTSSAVSNAYHFEIFASQEGSQVFVDWGNGQTSSENNVSASDLTPTAITSINKVTPGEALTIKFYGENIISITSSNKSYTDVEFTDNASSIKYLEVGTNKFTAFDASKLTALESITIGIGANNPSLDFTPCAELKKLAFTANSTFNNLNITGLTNLTDLNIAACAFTTLDLTTNTALKNIVMSNNPFSDINAVLATLPNGMTSITAQGCNIETIDASRFTDLTSLNISKNPIKSINVSGNSKLRTLFLATATGSNACDIDVLDLSTNLALATVTVNGSASIPNGIKSIVLPTTGEHTEAYVDLNASYNKLKTFPATVLKIRRLTLNNNEIESIVISSPDVTDRLYLANNKLTLSTLPTKPSVLTTLNYFTYIGQAQMEIAESIKPFSETLDLSKEASVQGILTAPAATLFTWKKASDNSDLVKNTDYTEDEAGKFVFNSALNGEVVYCVLATDAFPLLTGNNALRTTNLKIDVQSSITNNEINNRLYAIAFGNTLKVGNVEANAKVSIFSVDGKEMKSAIATSNEVNFNLAKGVYIVKTNNQLVKAVIK